MYNKDKTTISQNSSTKHSAFNIYQLFPQRTEDECLAELKQYPKLYWTYKRKLALMTSKKPILWNLRKCNESLS